MTVTGTGSTWTNSAVLEISSTDSGTASVEIKDGGTLNVTGLLSLVEPSGVPTATLALRTGGTINTQSFSRGDGTLTFTGGTMNINGGIFSNGTTPTTLIIDGDTPSVWPTLRLSNNATTANIGSMAVGDSRQRCPGDQLGHNIQASNDIILGNGFDSWGSILVSGTGSSLQSSNTLEIGSNGRGSLMVSGGGSVADNYGYIGMLGGSSGNVNISGAGSTWSYSGQTLRGLLRHRFFNYFRGRDGLGSCGWYRYGIGNQGMVSLSGASSSWTMSSNLSVGQNGMGTMTIAEGGTVSNYAGYVGDSTGGVGTVTVTDTGSTWTNSTGLTIGSTNGGNASVEVKDGGTLNIGTTLSLVEPDGTPTATLKLRTGGTINTTSFSRGDGTLTFTGGTLNVSGGEFSNGTTPRSLILDGDTPSALPTLRLSNNATTVNIGTMFVGHALRGAVEISSGAELIIPELITLGYGAYSSGSILVSGMGSLLQSSSSLGIGFTGVGSLTISGGGSVADKDGKIGLISGSSGTVTISGADSKWSNSSEIIVGDSGNGSLIIFESGTVLNQDGYVGYNYGGSGTVTVTGTGSTWTNSTGLTIGSTNGGNALVEIKDGGTLNVGTTLSLEEPDGTPTATLKLRTGGTINTASFSRGDGNADFWRPMNVSGGELWNGPRPDMIVAATACRLPTLRLKTSATQANLGSMTVEITTRRRGNLGAEFLTTGSIDVGNIASSSGSILVSGTDSSLQSSAALDIGSNGSGSLTISDSGSVADKNGCIGFLAGSSGTVNISGADSTWSNSGIFLSLIVGIGVLVL